MKPDEKHYASLRLQAALDHRLGLQRKAPTKNQGVTDMDKFDAIRNGDVDLKRVAKPTDALESAFDFRNLVPSEELDQKVCDEAALILRQEAAIVQDMLMPNTVAEDEAVKAIVEFCKDCPGV